MKKQIVGRREFVKISALGSGAAILAACTPQVAPVGVAAASTAVTPAEVVAVAGPAAKATLALAYDVEKLDPAMTYSLNNGRWQKNVFGYLTCRDEEMNTDTTRSLAISYEQVDDKTIVFKLREGVKFHNGEDFNADAVVFSFKRLLDEANASPQAFNYAAIDHFEKINDYSVRMVMKAADPVILTKLAGYGAAIVPPKFVAEKGNSYVAMTNIPGTGPYKIVDYQVNDSLTLEAFDGYWGELPKIKNLVYRIIPDDATRLAEFISGGVDVLTLTPSQVEAVTVHDDLGVIPVGVPTVSALRLDASKPPTDNPKVRAAICYAIDTKLVIKTILQGHGSEMAVWQSPFSFGYDPDLKPYAYDPGKAKQLIAESGVTNLKLGFSVIGDDTQMKEIANVVKPMLEIVGFSVEISQKESATYYSDYMAGNLDNIVPFGWGGWTLDADNTYYSMYYTGESYNPSFSDPKIDALLDEQRGTLDQDKRKKIFFQINKLIMDQYPDAMLYQNQYLWGVNKRLRDLALPVDERLWWAPASTIT